MTIFRIISLNTICFVLPLMVIGSVNANAKFPF